jgi:hypothetical protein
MEDTSFGGHGSQHRLTSDHQIRLTAAFTTLSSLQFPSPPFVQYHHRGKMIKARLVEYFSIRQCFEQGD